MQLNNFWIHFLAGKEFEIYMVLVMRLKILCRSENLNDATEAVSLLGH